MPLSRSGRAFIILLLASLVAVWGCVRADQSPPRARQGVLDLSAWNWQRDGVVRLNGEWDVWWGHLLTPDDLRAGQPSPPSRFTLPGTWNRVEAGGKPKGELGYATFRLRVKLPPGEIAAALRLTDIWSAWQLWADGRLLARSGTVGVSPQREVPQQSLTIVELPAAGPEVELLLQVSNHHYLHGGFTSPIDFGPAETVRTAQVRQWGFILLFLGSLLVMGLYHIILYLFRRTDPSPLWLGIYCLLWLGNTLTYQASGWVIHLAFPGAPWQLLFRIDPVCYYLSVPVVLMFLRSLYPEEFPRPLIRLYQVLGAGFAVFALAAPLRLSSHAAPFYHLLSLASIGCTLLLMLRAMARKREGAAVIMGGFLLLGCAGINDILHDLQIIHSVYLVYVGVLLFLLAQSFVVAMRLSRAFSAVERLSGELANKNVVLETEIGERNRLERQIVNVAEEARRRVSFELHDGLCQQLTAARLRCLALERKLAGSDEIRGDLSQLGALLEASVNQAYDLSRGLWPLEPEADGMVRSLETLVDRLSRNSDSAITFERDGDCEQCLSTDMAKLCRIAQEAITNAVKHARADSITVALHCRKGRQMTLSVRDDGVGIAATTGTRGGLGMSIMAHRARIIGGKLSIREADGGGTLVTCTVPCKIDVTEVSA